MATQNTEAASTDSGTVFEQQVNEVISNMVKGEDGKYQFPEGIPEHLKYAANAERRRRSTESALGKTRLQLKVTENVKAKLQERLVGANSTQLTARQAAELEVLKYEDPEEWHNKRNEYAQNATTSLQTELEGISTEASQQALQEARINALDRHNRDNPDYQITNEVIDNDIPPRITKKLTDGKIGFEEFLAEAKNFLQRPKKIGGAEANEEPNLSEYGGGGTPMTPSADQRKGAANNKYTKTVL